MARLPEPRPAAGSLLPSRVPLAARAGDGGPAESENHLWHSVPRGLGNFADHRRGPTPAGRQDWPTRRLAHLEPTTTASSALALRGPRRRNQSRPVALDFLSQTLFTATQGPPPHVSREVPGVPRRRLPQTSTPPGRYAPTAPQPSRVPATDAPTPWPKLGRVCTPPVCRPAPRHPIPGPLHASRGDFQRSPDPPPRRESDLP